MKANELRALVLEMNGDTERILSSVYTCPRNEKDRILGAIDCFSGLFEDSRETYLLSVSGRSEILGNHTDHNGGKVIAASIEKDVIALVSPNGTDTVNLKSEGYEKISVDLSLVGNKNAYPRYSSASLILGVADGLKRAGYSISGFDAYMTSDVPRGSGLSSSAAFEVMIGNAFNHLFCGGKVSNEKIAKIAQYAENEYFGKPCGLMDQMACAVGGFVYMDFENPSEPKIDTVSFSLSDLGYSLCIVNTGGNHADLNEDYASVPAEMKSVAAVFGKSTLRGLCEKDIIGRVSEIRENAGDRALLRALHFIRENERVEYAVSTLENKDLDGFFKTVIASGKSSFEYLQNLYTVKNVREQGLSLAIALSEGFAATEGGAYRVHGGGFAGTVQAYVKIDKVSAYTELMESVFGKGAVTCLNVRSVGAARLF